jgi:hypothetical protein
VLTAPLANVLQLDFTDNTGQGFAKAYDQLLAVLYVANPIEYHLFTLSGTREETSVNLPLPPYWSGQQLNAWVTFVDVEGKRAATSIYPGEVTAV